MYNSNVYLHAILKCQLSTRNATLHIISNKRQDYQVVTFHLQQYTQSGNAA